MDIDLSALTGLSDDAIVIIYRGNSPKYYSESLLYAHIRNNINDSGLFNVIKKCPAKDGHLTSAPYYIRERKGKWCLFDYMYAIRMLYEDFNAGKCVLTVHGLN
ncbi:MAG TPA: hypothetical protein VMV86_00355 [Methanosarcinales archaeon]|nr:hypothetical protein [Methanosarcinales archaeon]